jgi:hypothetical protein
MRFDLKIIVATLAAASIAHASPVTDELVGRLSRLAADNFWGKAVLSSGQPVQRPPDLDPNTPLIPLADARRVVEAAFPVGVAMWCKVEWRPYYLRFMQTERKRSWTQVQVAYIGVLFGLSQQTFSDALARDPERPCPAERRAEVEAALAAERP